jgi:plasmid stability protein
MPSPTIKNVPLKLYKRLQARAAQHRRSLNGEVIFRLEQALQSRRVDAASTLGRIHELRRSAGAFVLTDELLRKARNEGRP